LAGKRLQVITIGMRELSLYLRLRDAPHHQTSYLLNPSKINLVVNSPAVWSRRFISSTLETIRRQVVAKQDTRLSTPETAWGVSARAERGAVWEPGEVNNREGLCEKVRSSALSRTTSSADQQHVADLLPYAESLCEPVSATNGLKGDGTGCVTRYALSRS
jgi:hypothetical protein